MALNEILYLVIVPPDLADDSLIAKIANLINKDPLSVRRLLSVRVPKIAIQYCSRSEAEYTLHNVLSLGAEAFVFSDAELRRPFSFLKAHALEFGQKEIIFRDKSGQECKIDSDDAFLIIKGGLEISQDKEVTYTRKEINITATLLTGIPIKRTVRDKTVETSVRVECFMRIYRNPPSDICIEIKQHGFDFSCLGQEMAPASLVNFNTLTRKVRQTFPGIFFEERVKESSKASVPFVSHMGGVDVTCKLIYEYYRLFGSRNQTRRD